MGGGWGGGWVGDRQIRLGGVAHNGCSTALMQVTTEEYEDQEHENIFFGTIRLEMQNKKWVP